MRPASPAPRASPHARSGTRALSQQTADRIASVWRALRRRPHHERGVCGGGHRDSRGATCDPEGHRHRRRRVRHLRRRSTEHRPGAVRHAAAVTSGTTGARRRRALRVDAGRPGRREPDHVPPTYRKGRSAAKHRPRGRARKHHRLRGAAGRRTNHRPAARTRQHPHGTRPLLPTPARPRESCARPNETPHSDPSGREGVGDRPGSSRCEAPSGSLARMDRSARTTAARR